MKPEALLLIAKKEWKESFNSPMPYVFLVVFYLLSGWFFTYQLFLAGQSSLEQFFLPMPILLAFFLPAFSMRLFAEEYKTGTIEVLATQPVRDVEIVVGKFLAVWALWGAALVLSFFYPILLYIFGRPDTGQILASYLGAFLLGGFYASAGLFASSLTRSQVVGFIVGFLFCFAFFLFGQVTQYLSGPVAEILNFLGAINHMDAFLRGVVDSRDVLYFISGIVLFLAATLASFNSRRWR